MALPGVQAELAAAIRAGNAAFERLSPQAQDVMVIGYDGLDRELDASINSGDRDRALRAIRAWRGHWLRQIERAGK